MKFLFREENVGSKNWKNRKKIVKKYFEIEENPFVEQDSSCGYSVSDFEHMLDRLRIKGIEVE